MQEKHKTNETKVTFKWKAALSLSVKTPVDSTMKSAPASPHGISSGFLYKNQTKHNLDMNLLAHTSNLLAHTILNCQSNMMGSHISSIDKRVPDPENSDGLLAEEKGLGVLDLELMVLPWAVNGVILEHVGLKTTITTQITNRVQTSKPKTLT